MESRNTRKNEINLKLILYISIPITTILIIANLYFLYLNNNLNLKINNNQNKLNNITNNYQEELTQKNSLEENLTFLNNIDESIIEARNNYYKTLKVFEDKVANKEINYKIAYITFDDGPYNLTNEYLKILEKYDIRATFFTIGLNKDTCFDNPSKSCKEMYQQEAKYGHTMANHTYSHLIFNGLYSSTDSFITQVKKQENLIKERTGLTTNIVRFPGGMATAGNLKNGITAKLREMGYGWVDWTAQDGDGGYVPDAATAMNTLKNSINEDIEVILFHDYNYITLEILPQAIEYLRSKNYVLLPLFYESKMVNK